MVYEFTLKTNYGEFTNYEIKEPYILCFCKALGIAEGQNQSQTQE